MAVSIRLINGPLDGKYYDLPELVPEFCALSLATPVWDWLESDDLSPVPTNVVRYRRDPDMYRDADGAVRYWYQR